MCIACVCVLQETYMQSTVYFNNHDRLSGTIGYDIILMLFSPERILY